MAMGKMHGLSTQCEVSCDHYHQCMAAKEGRSDASWWHGKQHSSRDLQVKCRCCPFRSGWSSGASW